MIKLPLIVLGLLITTALFVSCGSPDTDAPAEHAADDHASHSATAAMDEGLEGLGLNDGSKWKMDDHTRDMFAEMAASFVDTDHAALAGEGLQKAGLGLQAQTNQLIQGCTMNGPAHDQLHVLLTGYIPAVADLAKSGSIEDAAKVKHYLEAYGNYFE